MGFCIPSNTQFLGPPNPQPQMASGLPSPQEALFPASCLPLVNQIRLQLNIVHGYKLYLLTYLLNYWVSHFLQGL